MLRLGLALRDLGSSRQEQLQQAQLQLAQLRIQTSRLDGLPEKVEQSRMDADKFYLQRVSRQLFVVPCRHRHAVDEEQCALHPRGVHTPEPCDCRAGRGPHQRQPRREYSGVMHFIMRDLGVRYGLCMLLTPSPR